MDFTSTKISTREKVLTIVCSNVFALDEFVVTIFGLSVEILSSSFLLQLLGECFLRKQ